MTTVRGSVDVPGPPEAAQALWLDPRRWPAFVDGFGALSRVEGDWPRNGRAIWTSGPNGRGMVRETVVEHTAGARCVSDVEDEQLIGLQTVDFQARDDGTVHVRVELAYRLKDTRILMKLTDLLFVRRSQRDALRRTLRRYATEREGDDDMDVGVTLG